VGVGTARSFGPIRRREHDVAHAGDDVVVLVPAGRRDEVRALVEGA